MVLRYHRYILPEFNTHRAFARNSASSRAIPVERVLKQVARDPALPIHWGANRPGMQAHEELTLEAQSECERLILEHLQASVILSHRLAELGLHKQAANRYTEPFRFIETLVTATEWGNFFNLRCHPDAQPEFRELAMCVLSCYQQSVPVLRTEHLPFLEFISKFSDKHYTNRYKISTARCARISYKTYDGRSSPENDIVLHDRLRASGHWSPFEHPCSAMFCARDSSGPFRGWRQYRKEFVDENRNTFCASDLLKEWEEDGHS